MEASVAIIQHRSPCYSNDRIPSSPKDYDIIVLDEPSRPSTSNSSSKTEQNNYITKRSTVGNHAIGQTVIRLPYFPVHNPDSSLSESVLDAIYNKSRLQLPRAVPVPLFDDRQRQSKLKKPHVAPGTALMCVPVSSKIRLSYPYGRVENLARLVNLCLNTPEVLDVRTRHMIIRLDEWLSHSQCINPHFMASLFFCDSSKLRIICCVHNPAYVHDSCIKYMNKKAGSTKSVSSSIDLDEKVRIGNLARVQMMQYNKYNILVMNPSFGFQMPNVEIPKYFILGSEEIESNPTSDSDFALRYPLHNAALTGDQQTIRSLIAKNYDVNERDRDGWTPLHYSCFYNQISATDALLTAASADVNMRNKGGATALHISSINGNPYITELLLSHPRIDINICNNDGLNALDLCNTLPKIEYKQCARLMKEALKPEKIQIDLMDGGSLMVLLINGKDTKANEILNQICLELHISREALSLFGLWIYSDSLALQLAGDAKISLKLKNWSKTVTKSCGYEHLKDEEAKLMFRRSAHASFKRETEIQLDSFTKSLLYEEARQHFLAGRLPLSDQKTVVHLASILTSLLYGDKPKSIDSNQLENVLPQYLLYNTKIDWKTLLMSGLKKARKTSSNVDFLQTEFLKICQQLKIYGSTYFEAEIYKTKPIVLQEQSWCAINDQGLHLITIHQHIHRASYDYIELTFTQKNWDGRKVLHVSARAHDHQFYILSNQISHLIMLIEKIRNVRIVN